MHLSMLAVCHGGTLMILVIPNCHLAMEMAWYLQLDKNSIDSKSIFKKKEFITVGKVRLCTCMKI